MFASLAPSLLFPARPAAAARSRWLGPAGRLFSWTLSTVPALGLFALGLLALGLFALGLLALGLPALAQSTDYGHISGATVMGAPLPRLSTSIYDSNSNRTFVVYPAGTAVACDDGLCSPSTSTLRVFNNSTNQWFSGSLAVGDAISVPDGHAYPVITMTSDHKVHIFSGGHGTPLVHKVSRLPTTSSWNPMASSEWINASLPSGNIDRATYPLVFVYGDELFLFWRQSSLLLEETCGGQYYDPDGGNCVGKTYDPEYFSRWYKPAGSNNFTWSTPRLLIDPAYKRWVYQNGQYKYIPWLDGWDRIYVNGARQKGDRLLLSFTNTLQDNKQTDWHYFAVFHFGTQKLYPASSYKGSGSNAYFDSAGGHTTLNEVSFDEPTAPWRYYQNPAGIPGRRGSIAMDEDPAILRPQIFQAVAEDWMTCASCNDELNGAQYQTVKKSVRHFSWNSGWSSVRYFTNKTDPSKPIVSPDPLEVNYDANLGSGYAYRFHLLIGWESACKSQLTSFSCPDGTPQQSRCIDASGYGVAEHTKAVSSMGAVAWSEQELVVGGGSADERIKYFRRIPSHTSVAPPDMKGLYWLGTVDGYSRSCSWHFPKDDQEVHFWDGTYVP